jgi:hypothetical protein
MSPRELSYELRRGAGGYLRQRRGIVQCSLLSAATMGLVSLYQTGIIRHLPDPPISGFDADRVHGSAQGYSFLQTPDGLLGLGSFAATAALAAVGGEDRVRRRPWLPLALGAKVLFDSTLSIKLACDQPTKLRALSIWSLLSLAATLSSFLMVWPESLAALRRLLQPTLPAAMNAVPRHLWRENGARAAIVETALHHPLRLARAAARQATHSSGNEVSSGS